MTFTLKITGAISFLFPIFLTNVCLAEDYIVLKSTYSVETELLDEKGILEVEKKLGYVFEDKQLLVKALTSHATNPRNNYESLEFHGDSILRGTLSPLLNRFCPHATPKDLNSALSALVSTEPLAALGLRLQLYRYIQVPGKTVGIKQLEDVVEAIIGAIHQDNRGSVAAKEFIDKHFLPMIPARTCPTKEIDLIHEISRGNYRLEYKTLPQGTLQIHAAKIGGKHTGKSTITGRKGKNRLALYNEERKLIRKIAESSFANRLIVLATENEYKAPLPLFRHLSLESQEGMLIGPWPQEYLPKLPGFSSLGVAHLFLTNIFLSGPSKVRMTFEEAARFCHDMGAEIPKDEVWPHLSRGFIQAMKTYYDHPLRGSLNHSYWSASGKEAIIQLEEDTVDFYALKPATGQIEKHYVRCMAYRHLLESPASEKDALDGDSCSVM